MFVEWAMFCFCGFAASINRILQTLVKKKTFLGQADIWGFYRLIINDRRGRESRVEQLQQRIFLVFHFAPPPPRTDVTWCGAGVPPCPEGNR